MPKNKKKRKISQTRRRPSKESSAAVESIRKEMRTVALGTQAATQLLKNWTPPYASLGSFTRFEWKGTTIKNALQGVEIARFEADNQSKLWVALADGDTLDSDFFSDALRAAFSENLSSKSSISSPTEIIFRASATIANEIQEKVEGLLSDLRESSDGVDMEIGKVEKTSLGKGEHVLRFLLAASDEQSAKRQRTGEPEKDKKELLPIAMLGNTGSTGAVSGIGGGGGSDAGEDGSDDEKDNSSKGRRGRGGSDTGGDGGDDDDDKRGRKQRRTHEEEAQDDDDLAEDEGDDDEGKEEGATPRVGRKRDTSTRGENTAAKQVSKRQRKKSATKKAHLLFGLTVKGLSDEELAELRPAVDKVYEVHPYETELLEAWEAHRGKDRPENYPGKPPDHPPHPLSVPLCIVAEISPQQIQEIANVKDAQQFKTLLNTYKKKDEERPDLYLAAWLHHSGKDWFGKLDKRILDILRQILTSIDTPEKAAPIITDILQLWKPLTSVEEKRKTALDAIDFIKKALRELHHLEDFPDDILSLDDYAEQIKTALKGDNGKLLLALYDYANTEFSKFKVMETPWQLALGNKATMLERIARVLAAQLALMHTVIEPVPDGEPVFRWKEGIEEHKPGALISPMALWSCSKGSNASEAFGKKSDCMLFVIQNSRTGRFIQLNTGTKNWYQREVLFPAYAQFVVKFRHEFNTGQKDKLGNPVRVIGYVLEETSDSIQQYLQDEIPHIGLPTGDLPQQAYPLLPEFLLNSLVDWEHRQLFAGKTTLPREQLEAEGIEFSDEIKDENIALASVYGAETHTAWAEMMKRKDPRRAILSLDMLKSYCFGLGVNLKDKDDKLLLLKNAEDVPFRDFEDGWGDEDTFYSLSEKEREALKANGLLVYPTLAASSEEVEDYIQWVEGKKFGRPIQAIKGPISKKKYLEDFKGKLGEIQSLERQLRKAKTATKEEAHLRERLAKLRTPIPDEHMFSFLEKTKGKGSYDASAQKYAVSYGHPMQKDENLIVTNLTKTLDEFSTALEQSLALYIDKQISRQEYVEAVYGLAAQIQQSIVAIHPFENGNGRLSRLLMYKVLMAYLPEKDLLETGLPLIKETGKDLLSTEKEWAELLLKSDKIPVIAPKTRSGGQPGGDSSDDEDDDTPSDKGGKPQGPSSGKPGPQGGNQDKDRDKDKDSDDKKGGQGQPPYLRKTYKASGAGDTQLHTFVTVGSGNCGIHAMRGGPNMRGVYEARDHATIRRDLSRRIFEVRNNDLLKARFVILLNELFTQIGSAQRLRGDLLTLWRSMNTQIQNLREQVNASLEQSRAAQEELQNRLEQIKIEVKNLLLDGQENTHFLRLQLRKEILASQEAKLAYLQTEVSSIQSHDEFIQLLTHLDEGDLLNLIYENLGVLIEKMFVNNVFGEIVGRYSEYQDEATTVRSLYHRFVVQNYDALMQAYANSVAVDGYYLHDEDLMVLADMSGRGLAIYVADNDRPGHFVRAIDYNPQNHADVVIVFHIGLHYERANLIRPLALPLSGAQANEGFQ